MIQLVVILGCISYLTGILWFIFCDFHQQVTRHQDLNFIREFGIDSQDHSATIKTLTYFMFTTLSTVGLGDYHPVSDYERVFGSLILLFGVLTTSVVMENLN